jgi:hypothetical protein
MEPKELSPEVAGRILDADFQNIVKKVATGKPLTVAERTRIESLAAGQRRNARLRQDACGIGSRVGRDSEHIRPCG